MQINPFLRVILVLEIYELIKEYIQYTRVRKEEYNTVHASSKRGVQYSTMSSNRGVQYSTMSSKRGVQCITAQYSAAHIRV